MTAVGAVDRVRAQMQKVLSGKDNVIDLLLVGLFGAGHVLVEDVPGVGKTTLAKALSKAVALSITRVQFTPDLLPTDILGSQILNPKDGTLTFQQGPVFTNVLLADEINRASPRTQSALLEAMNEAQATVDGGNARMRISSPQSSSGSSSDRLSPRAA
ncbi:MAG: AAA family ATPase [Polyangiaceae bacterium]|jgi:MoxR-like ATPase